MTEYGFLQALSYFKCVSGSTGFRGSTLGAFEGASGILVQKKTKEALEKKPWLKTDF